MSESGAVRRAKRAYVAGVRGADRLLTRARLLPTEPPARQHVVRHWAYSLGCVHDAARLAALDVPWWTYRAIGAVEQWLAARPRPARVFEYGTGASTVWLARRAGTVWSVEHDFRFAPAAAELAAGQPNVELFTVAPVCSSAPVAASGKEGFAGLDFADYVAAIDQLDADLDLVVIDGRARAACLARAVPHLRDDGIIVFDNSARRRYRNAIDTSGLAERRYRGLTPTLPYPEQTSLLRRTPPTAS